MIMITGGCFQGKTEFAEKNFPNRELIVHFEKKILECIEKNEDTKVYTDTFIREHPEAVVVMHEIGNGIVPADKTERIWREEAGRAGCIIAEKAEKVYRVLAGIGVRIK